MTTYETCKRHSKLVKVIQKKLKIKTVRHTSWCIPVLFCPCVCLLYKHISLVSCFVYESKLERISFYFGLFHKDCFCSPFVSVYSLVIELLCCLFVLVLSINSSIFFVVGFHIIMQDEFSFNNCMQIVVWRFLQRSKGSDVSATKNALLAIVLLQYIPRLLRILPLTSELKRTAGVFAESAWAGAAYYLLWYMLACHVSILFHFFLTNQLTNDILFLLLIPFVE